MFSFYERELSQVCAVEVQQIEGVVNHLPTAREFGPVLELLERRVALRLYLPKEWTDDRPRCYQAGIPDTVSFATKPVLAQKMIERAVAAGVPFGWLTGDEAYGQDTKLRMWLELNDIAHVMAVPCNTMLVSTRLLKERVDRLIAEIDRPTGPCGVPILNQGAVRWHFVSHHDRRAPST